MNAFISLLKQEEGATVIEYAVIGALISVAAIAAMASIGTYVCGSFRSVAGNLTTSR